MRKIISSNWLSLDGFIAGRGGALDWILGDGQLAQYETELMAGADTTIFGRTTYEQLSGYWSAIPDSPQAMDWERPYAQMINAAHHVVVSRGLETASWGKATIWRDIDADEVRSLKGAPGKNILMFGSASVVQQLTKLGVIDEYHLLIHPVLLGGGIPLFDGVEVRSGLKRVDVQPFDSGIVKLVLERR